VNDSAFDRADPIAAAEITRNLCPAKNLRRLVLGQLLRSVSIADRLAPHSWAVTLWRKGFRLNVGQVEAYVFLEGEVRLFLLGGVPKSVESLGEILPSHFQSMPSPQYGFYGTPKALERAAPVLDKPHADFIRTAAVTTRGRPRRTPFARTHSPGLVTYANNIVGVQRTARGA
jgi:hypothetical protein